MIPTETNAAELSKEEVAKKAWALYESGIKARVEKPETIGQFVTVDILSGDYEVGSNHIATVAAIRARHENVRTFTLRIGYRATYSHGGRMVRTS